MNFAGDCMNESPVLSKAIPFLRYGGLAPVKQVGFGKTPTFHSPPAKAGFYAFPIGAVERFLLGTRCFDHRRMVPVIKASEIRKANRLWLDPSAVGTKFFMVWKKAADKEFFDNNWQSMTYEEREKFRSDHQIWAKHAKPRRFYHFGYVWSHLEDHIKDKKLILRRKHCWVLTDYDVWKQAFVLAQAEVRKTGYSRDHLEVFIERLGSETKARP